jgi:putative intracellular protease/amidase/DNA-directed RNA polymerase subunit RPC12/RpoP
MRKFLHALVLTFFAFWLLAAILDIPSVHSQVIAKTVYVCPMRCGNAEYEKPGTCSTCGMTLVVKDDDPKIDGKNGYVCPPCGAGCDDKVYDKPGACPTCGMKLVEKGSAQASNAANNKPATQQVLAHSKKVAIFIFDGVQIIDFTGPYEVFGQAGFEVFTVAAKPEPITTAMGMTVTPKYTFANYPKPDILVVPGGNVPAHQDKPEVVKWLQDNAQQAETVLSVCNGAYFLAKAGLLDGLKATTFAALIDGLQAAAPKAQVVSNQRFVDNGKIITSAGLSSGIDGAMHVVEKLLGKGWAQCVATGLEYNWDPESKYVRAALADKYLLNTYDFMRRFEREVISHEGSTDHWENKWKVQTEAAAAEVLEQINNNLATADKWVRQGAAKTNGATASRWKFVDPQNQAWEGSVSVQADPNEKNKLLVTVKIAREGVETNKS